MSQSGTIWLKYEAWKVLISLQDGTLSINVELLQMRVQVYDLHMTNQRNKIRNIEVGKSIQGLIKS